MITDEIHSINFKMENGNLLDNTFVNYEFNQLLKKNF